MKLFFIFSACETNGETNNRNKLRVKVKHLLYVAATHRCYHYRGWHTANFRLGFTHFPTYSFEV